jgi:putative Ca2+/H+ antiporter (TMEM165/GDT1 family)
MSIDSAVRAFATVFPAELPDKTMVATVLLVTRYRRPLPVWGGAVAAFAIHVTVAVAAGKAISLLPDVPVNLAVAAMFLTGSVLLFRAARKAPEPDSGLPMEETTGHGALLGSFGLILLAEWGDLTQLATASLAARSGDAIGTGVGALAALASVAAIAAAFGRQLIARVPLARINYIGAAVFLALAIWTLVELAIG